MPGGRVLRPVPSTLLIVRGTLPAARAGTLALRCSVVGSTVHRRTCASAVRRRAPRWQCPRSPQRATPPPSPSLDDQLGSRPRVLAQDRW